MHLARGLSWQAPRGACRAGPAGAAACLDLQRVVQPERYARDRDPVLSGPPPPDAAREEDDHRRGGWDVVGVHEHSAPRGRPRGAAFLSAASPAALAAVVRAVVAALSALLPAEPGEPPFRAAPAPMVRAEPSG